MDILNTLLSAENDQTLLRDLSLFFELKNEPFVFEDFLRRVNGLIAQIDNLLTLQLNEILHHPDFQRLEASWQGICLLVDTQDRNKDCQLKLLDLSWEELKRDMGRSMEFDQTELFNKIYNNEFGSPGGEPFGLIVGDYYLQIQGSGSREDLDALDRLSGVMAASFCPFVTAITANAFGVDQFSSLFSFSELDVLFKQSQYTRWRSLRKQSDLRFMGLVFPRVRLRDRYKNDGLQSSGVFPFEEILKTNEDVLWGNACFAFACVVMRSFVLTGWPAAIRGYKSQDEASGLVQPLARKLALTDQSPPFSCEILIDPFSESQLAEQGLISLCQLPQNGSPIFYSNASVLDPTAEYSGVEDINAKISAMLQYILSASRFAHYVKVLARDWLGSYYTAGELQAKLTRWIANYIASNDVGDDLRRRYPLQGAKVEIYETPGQPGHYQSILYLQPKLQVEKVENALKLVTELGKISSIQ